MTVLSLLIVFAMIVWACLLYISGAPCRHDWEIIEGWNLRDTRPPLYRCKKCGREEGL